MASRYWLPALIGAAFLVSACPVKYPKCKTDETCKEHGEVCINGSCQECGQDGDCKAGFVCKDTKCTPKPECQSDGECLTGYKCQEQKCAPIVCAADAECPKGLRCKDNRCQVAPECISDADCAAGMRCGLDGKCAAPVAVPEAAGCTLEAVYFDFNDFALTATARAAVDRNATCLKTSKGKVTVAGNADERGTEEYNLHLGERRANAVKKYLLALGLEASRLNVVSYGEERPANPGHDEAAWAQNRRVEFTLAQ